MLIKNKSFPFFLSVCLLLIANTAQAKIYKCKDKDGVVNYTSVPCGQKTIAIKPVKKKVKSKADETTTNKQFVSERLKKGKAFLDARKKERQEEEKKRAEYERKQQEVNSRCERAQQRLRMMYQANLAGHRAGYGAAHDSASIIANEKYVLEVCGKKLELFLLK